MKSLIAFTKKEITEQIRSGKLLFLCILFCALGVMNPAVAKLTPWFYEIFADSLSQSGIVITAVEVSALDSWLQFFKNIPMGIIAFVLIEGSIFTKEYSSGTLVLSLTKGLSRRNVLISKTLILVSMWTVMYWMCFGITYAYNAYFWDNSIAKNLLLSVVCCWVFGLLISLLIVMLSALTKTSTGVFLGVGLVVLACYIVSMIPKIGKYLPTFLMDGNSLIYGLKEAGEYIAALVISIAAIIVCFAASIPVFNKKQL